MRRVEEGVNDDDIDGREPGRVGRRQRLTAGARGRRTMGRDICYCYCRDGCSWFVDGPKRL